LPICPSGYSLKAHSITWSEVNFLRSWRFEGSHDGLNWDSLDTQTDNTTLTENDKEDSFPVSASTGYRFLRILILNRNWSGNNWVGMQQIELFGRIISSIFQSWSFLSSLTNAYRSFSN
jgi:hypothetical protein